jgi:hypothetical protein
METTAVSEEAVEKMVTDKEILAAIMGIQETTVKY